MTTTHDPIAAYEQLAARIAQLAAAPLDAQAVLTGQSTTTAQLLELRALLTSWQPAYDVAMAERRAVLIAQNEEAHARATEELERQAAIRVIDQQLAQVEREQAEALARFAVGRNELQRRRRLLTGDIQPGDIPVRSPDDVVMVFVPAGTRAGVDDRATSAYMTVREAMARGLAPLRGWHTQ